MINNYYYIVQVLLVTGGYTGSNALSSTELLLPSATSWSYSAALPSPRDDLRGATLNNKVVMTGTNSEVTNLDPSYMLAASLLHTSCKLATN